MPERTVSLAVLFLLLTNVFISSFFIMSVNASGTVYIRADGSIDPPTAPVSSFDNVTYKLTDNITTYSNNGIILERSNIILDGAGFTLDEKIRHDSNGIYLAGVSNVTVRNMSITSFHNGVCENGCTNSHVEEMNLSYNDYGIYLQSSSFSVISGNNMTENTCSGIWLELSKNNLICKNGMANLITSSGIGGIKLQDGSDYNNITENYLKSNSIWNIYIENSHYNNIFHNSIFDNYGYSDSSGNLWNDDYPSGGNYWSNHGCTDFCSGPSQNEFGSDGIGDTPYIIDVNTIDHYPLMKPYPWGPHDIGITNVAPSRTMVGQGFALSIKMTVFNYGAETECFNATAYANATSISTCENVIVEGRNSTTISLVWDTMGFTLGNYTIGATAEPVPAEVDNTDNTRVDGTVQITESVTVSPSSVVMDVGQFQTFSSNVTGGTSPYTYQWYLNSNPVSGATNSTWMLTPVSAGSYTAYAKVTDAVDVVAMSRTVPVIVNGPLSIHATPSSVTMDIGQSQLFTSTVSNGTSPFTYQWYLNDLEIPTATSPVWIFTPSFPDSYDVYVKVTDSVSYTAKSNIAAATVNPTLSVSLSPTSVLMDVGQSTPFISNVSGGQSPYIYQWYLDGAPVSGATSNDWIFTPTFPNSYVVYVEVTDNLGIQATSSTATVTVHIHDVAVTNVTPCKTVVCQSYGLEVTVTAADLGDCPETFNFTVYANATIIVSQNITLSSGNFTTVTITWETRGFAYGNYTLSVFALPVSGETDTSNNNFTGDWVTVSLVGDITGPDGWPDGKCDMRDIGYVARRFMCKSGKVDMKDIGITGRHFIEHNP
jgi:parallel beta-helix repeat protein